MNKIFLSFLMSLLTLFACAQGNLEINPVLLNSKWKANWITHPSASFRDYQVLHFRKKLNLSAKPEKFVIHVSADSRYKLYINGEEVSTGPAKGDKDHWNFETLDIASQLKAGENIVSSVVWHFGENNPVAQMTYRTAFIVQGNTDKEEIINTDASWKTFVNEAYKPLVIKPVDIRLFYQYYVAGPLDSLDGRKHPWGWETARYNDNSWQNAKLIGSGTPAGPENHSDWTLVPRSIPFMESKLQRFAEAENVKGLSVPLKFLQGKQGIKIPANTKASFLLDQKELTLGYPILSVSGGLGASLKLIYAESPINREESEKNFRPIKPNRNQTEGMDVTGIYDVFKFDGGENRTYSPLWIRTFRYVKVEIETASDPLIINDLYSKFSAYPFKENGSFSSSEPLYKDIWNVSWRTARLCAHETYMDCPYYEQLQYFGDTRIQALVSLYVSGDDRLMRNAINHGQYSRNPEGLTQSRYPSELSQYTPLYSICWALIVKDYWMHRKDDAFVKQFLPGISSVFSWFENQLNEKGMLEGLPYLDFVDTKFPRAQILKNSKDKSMSVHSLFMAYGLQELAPLFRYYKEDALADKYTKMASALKQAVNQNCFDPSRNLYADTPDKNSFSQHANVLAVLTDAMAAPKQAELMQKVISDKSLIKCELYFQFYLFNALQHAGMGNTYQDVLTPWKNMLAQGLTTFPEWEVQPRSDCHAWSASPNYQFLSIICGIRPTKPGFSETVIAPALGNLKWVKGSIPHPYGSLSVDLKKKGTSGIEGQVLLPKGLSGEFHWNGKVIALREGTQKILIKD